MNTSEHTPQHASQIPEERPTSTVQKRSYTEHRILRGASAIYARHYAGTGPAFVLMHGFPDNLHIYDRLIPYLRDRQCICQGYRVARSLHEALPTSDLSLPPKKGH